MSESRWRPVNLLEHSGAEPQAGLWRNTPCTVDGSTDWAPVKPAHPFQNSGCSIHWHARCQFETGTVIIGEAETFRFTAQELERQQANLTPQEVAIHRGHDVEAGLRFVLDNPTTRTHAFEAPGVLEQIAAETRELITRPLRITVAPGETVEVRVRFTQIERDPETPCAEGAACYRFYCPQHRGDNDPGGLIRVMP